MNESNSPFVRSADGDGTNDPVAEHPGFESVRSAIVSFVRDRVFEANATGVVVAMSGGIDSTLTAMLAVEALGRERVLGLGLPCNESDDRGGTEAHNMAEGLGIEFREVHLRPLLDVFEDSVAPAIDPGGDRHAIGNVIARLRMICTYYAANTRSRLVLGTGNRSERLLGYFTKYGDGGADLCPIADLYKTEVKALASRMGVPRRIVTKQPTAGLWTGQTDADDLGAPYEVIDPVLRRLVDGESVEATADAVNVDIDTVRSIAERYTETRHKRYKPPTPGVDGSRLDG
jgi:NAD+ synthase